MQSHATLAILFSYLPHSCLFAVWAIPVDTHFVKRVSPSSQQPNPPNVRQYYFKDPCESKDLGPILILMLTAEITSFFHQICPDPEPLVS